MSLHAIEAASADVASQIEAALLADLRLRNPQGRNEAITLCAQAPDGSLVAGLSGSTSYGWLLIKVLWVAPEWRWSGYGRALVGDALRRAKALGCHSVWLDTSDNDAKQFYTTMGFEVFGILHNQGAQVPPGHQRWFLKCHIP